MAIAMTLFGLHSLLLPVLPNTRYQAVLLLLSPLQFALACVLVGITRIVVLRKNGEWPIIGPRLRALIAILAAAIWGQLAVALMQSPAGSPSPGMWIYLVLMGAELRSVWRARRDGNGP